MTLKEMLAEIKTKKAQATMDVSQLKPGVQATAEGIRQTAEGELRVLIDRYKTEAVNKSVIIASMGKGCHRYAEVAASQGLLVVDYQSVVSRISNNLMKRSSSEVFGNQEWWLFLDELNFLKREFDILNIPQPHVDRNSDPVFEHPIRAAVSAILSENYGEALHSAIVRRMIGEEAFERQVDGEHLFVVLYNCVEVDLTMLPKPISAIEVNDDTEKDEIIDHLDKIKQMISPKKKPGRKPKSEEISNDTDR